MNRETVDARTYNSHTRCWQGPIEARFEGAGATWGETIEIRACSPAGVRAVAEVRVDGGYANSGPVGSGEVDNSRCVVGDAVAASGTGAGSAASSASGDRSGGDARAVSVTQNDQFAITRSTDDDVCFATMTTALVLGRVERGADIVVRVWAKVPVDLEGGVFQIRHEIHKPNVSDDEWEKHLAKKRAKRAKHAEREHEITREELDAMIAAQKRELERDDTPTSAPPPPKREARPGRPYAGAEWMPGYWTWSKEWVWIRGRWRAPKTAPALRAETRPPAPSPDRWVWSPGYWQWDGRTFAWVAGVWLESTR